MGRNTGGIYSLPGSDFVSGTVINSTTMNTKFNDIEAALTDSLSRAGNGDMLAPLRVPDGSAAIPSFSWSSDIGTGFYLAATSSFRAVILASTVQEWTATSVAINKALTTAAGVTANNSTTNGAGLTATGNGTGSGVVATGGTSGAGVTATGVGSASGVVATGGATGNGISASGGATSGAGGAFTGVGASAGLTAQGGATNGAGATGTGGGIGPGIRGVGGAAGGVGVSGQGTDNHGGTFLGTGPGAGVVATGAAGSPGAYLRNGTAATSGTPRYGVICDNGYVSLDGATAPASTTAIKNAVTPINIVKAWALITIPSGGKTAGSYTDVITAGYNISSVTVSSTQISVSFAQAFSTAAVGGLVTINSGTTITPSVSSSSTSATVSFSGGYNPTTTAITLTVLFFGAQ